MPTEWRATMRRLYTPAATFDYPLAVMRGQDDIVAFWTVFLVMRCAGAAWWSGGGVQRALGPCGCAGRDLRIAAHACVGTFLRTLCRRRPISSPAPVPLPGRSSGWTCTLS